ncbi:MAG: ParB/RepB/Spo0J family partition protein [Sphaerochaeta sp.]|jgi:ParB-like chromosome segregation protein Spo0J|nr:ParB/RepB/Spo0J family partition protein [Sphaerochaeta sp.]MDD4986234.1 ParB/RepB/Spo0J family partition protein [Dehalococcoidales bacterium]
MAGQKLLKNVDPNRIKIPELRVTARFDEESRRQFKESVKSTGIDEPIKCWQVGEDLVLSDGLHRLQEALDNNMRIDVYVREGSMEDVLCNNLMSGHLRGKHPVSEMVKVIEALWKEYSWDSDKIAAHTGLTRDYVEKLQSISQLTPACREALDDDRIKVGHANCLTRIENPVKQETVLQQLLLYHWSVKDLDAYVDEVLKIIEAPAPIQQAAEPPKPHKVRCTYCQGEFEVQQIANPNTCQGCSAIMFESIRLARAEAEREQASAAASSPAAGPETKT